MLETDDAIACSYISWSKMDYGLCDTRGRKRQTQNTQYGVMVWTNSTQVESKPGRAQDNM